MACFSSLRRAQQPDAGHPRVAVFLLLSLMCCLPRGAAHATWHVSSKEVEFGLASYYSHWFDGRETASGEIFDNHEMVAAHPSFPLGTVVRVTRIAKRMSVIVRVNDRGPSIRNQKQGVIIDLSQAAANKLKMHRIGRAMVRVDVLKWGTDYKKPLVAHTRRRPGEMRTALR